jgi:WD40 repeat protein
MAEKPPPDVTLEYLNSTESLPPTHPTAVTPAAAPPPSAKPPFGGYELLDELAHGGMGIVYKARQIAADRIVALKMLLSGAWASPEQIERFRVEAVAAAKLDHPHILPIYEVGTHDEQHYFTMKFVTGGTLADRLKPYHNRGVPAELLPEWVRTLTQVTRAIHFAHQHGILHRDLKPANILLDADGTPFVCDFGLAKNLVDDTGQLTHTGAIMGTPAYMPPEQARAEATLTVAADVYGLGAMLFEVLTGRPPFVGRSAMEIVTRVMVDEPPSVRSLAPQSPRDLATIAAKCLEKRPQQRYESAGLLADELDRWLRGEPIAARPVSTTERVLRWCWRNPVVSGLVALVVVALVTGLGVAIHYAQEAAERARVAELAQAEAKSAQTEALVIAEVAQANLYVARINLAFIAFTRGHLDQALKMLEPYATPAPDQRDRRGWEWHYIWEMANDELHRWEWPSWARAVPAVSYAHDGTCLALVVADDRAEVWDVQRNTRRATLTGAAGAWKQAVFSADGTSVAGLAAHEPRVCVWDTATGARQRALTVPTATHFALSDTGAVLAVHTPTGVTLFGKSPTQVRFWGNLVEDGRLAAGVFHPDEKRYWCIDHQHRVTEYNLAANERRTLSAPLCPPSTTTPWRLTLANHGDRLLASSDTGLYRVDITATPPTVHHDPALALPGHRPLERLVAARVGPTFVAQSDRYFTSYHADRWSLIDQQWDRAEHIDAVAVRRDGLVGAFVGSDRTVKIWPLLTYTSSVGGTPVGYDSTIEAVEYAPDGRTCALGGVGQVTLFDTQTWGVVRDFPTVSGTVAYLAHRPQSSELAAVAGNEPQVPNRLYRWDTATGAELPALPDWPAGVGQVAYLPDGRTLVGAFADGRVRLWDLTTLGPPRVFSPPDAQPLKWAAIAVDPQGRWLASMRADHAILIWDARTGQLVHTLAGHTAGVGDLLFSPDGHTLGSGGDDRLVRVWDVRAGTLRHTLVGHVAAINAVIFSPDGRRLVSAGGGAMIKLWDLATGQEVRTLTDHTGNVRAVAFSPDGQTLVSGGDDRTLFVNDARPATPAVQRERMAVGLLEHLSQAGWPRGDLLAALNRYELLDPATRQLARELAPVAREYPEFMRRLAWDTVRPGSAPTKDYTLALRQARRATELVPSDVGYRTTLAWAHYRARQFAAARAVLERNRQTAAPTAAEIALVALLEHQAGRLVGARLALGWLRGLPDVDAQLVAEVSAALAGPAP